MQAQPEYRSHTEEEMARRVRRAQEFAACRAYEKLDCHWPGVPSSLAAADPG